MESGIKIAISGKGGVGKTTITAVWSELLAHDGYEVLAIDADSNPNLALAFGLGREELPTPLIEMKELIQERTGAQPGSVGQYFKLNPKVSDLPETYCHSVGKAGLKLLVLGGIRQAGRGCACPESAFLKALLSHTILQRSEAIIVDLDAGVEFLGRASVLGIQVLVIVVEPGSRSIETASHIAQMAQEMGITQIAAIANKITDPSQVDIIQKQLDNIPLLGGLPYSMSLPQADLNGVPALEADAEIVCELAKAKENLLKLVDNELKVEG